MKIGIFDSGIGGQAVAASLALQFPEATIVRVDDRAHLPYGDRSLTEVTQLTAAAIQPLLTAQCDVIVLACNTATAAAIDYLRSRYPHQPFVGLEPMVKPAAATTRSGVIAICATPATLSSDRYKNLVTKYASTTTVLEPDCSAWAAMIEDNKINERSIEQTIAELLTASADVIVLACTHYHWIRQQIETVVDGRAEIIDPSQAIGARIRHLTQSDPATLR